MLEAAMQLLSAALDPSGYIAIVGLREGHPTIQTFFAPGDYQGACDQAERLSAKGYDAYFATSTLKTNTSRKADNANAVKVFKVDLDVGEGDKKYLTQRDAVTALLAFCTAHGLPVPVLVSSGWGVHAYWILAEALDQDDGKLYAEKFKASLLAHGLKIDPTVTGDIARILRVPGTLNHKVEGNPRPVALKSAIALLDTDAMLDHIDRIYGSKEIPKLVKPVTPGMMDGLVIPAHLRGKPLDKMTRGLLEGKPKKFTVLLRRSIEDNGKGCAQIKYANDNQHAMDEPRWRSALSIAKFCEDGPDAIHMISRHHPGYDEAATIAKADLIPAPHTCKTFASNWPAQCKECPHMNKITSPIQLGDYVPRAPKGDNLVLAQNKAVEEAPQPYKIPEFPYPYFRSANGGVWRSSNGGDVDGEDLDEDAEQVCKMDFYIVNRLKDENEGYIGQFRLHHPKDGVVDFTMESSMFGSLDKLREALNTQGLLAYDKEVFSLRSYITRWFETLANREEVAMVKTQFGWTADFKSFVIGEREVKPNSVVYSPTAPSLAGMTKLFSKKGDLHEWRKVYNTYAMPGFEAQAFCALVGFASPLLALTPHAGVLINAFSQASGTGKSTLLKAALSIWGDPHGLMLTYRDTYLARIHRMGVHKNMPICVDEVTRMTEEDMSDTLFSATAGRGRNRMSSSANMERVNNTTWSAITLTSANTSFTEKLQAEKHGVEGELMRLLEPHIKENNVLTKLEADRIFGALDENFGHAGEVYMQFIMNNMERVKRMMATEQQALDRDGQFLGKERYWSAACATILVGGMLSQECGLHDIDMDAVRKYMLVLINQMRGRMQFSNHVTSKADLLGEFLSTHSMNILTVKVEEERKMTTVLNHNPSQALYVRWEQNLDTMYILQTEFRKFCKDRNVHLDDYIKDQTAAGNFIGNGQKRMAAGTNMPSSPARVFVFKVMQDIKDIVPKGDQ